MTSSRPGEDGVAVLTLARAEKRNALSIALRDEMCDALDQPRGRHHRASSWSPAPVTCSAPASTSTSSPTPSSPSRLWESSDRWHRTVITFPLPTVAAVNGAALGGGFDLAVMCDLRRLRRPRARFAHPEHRFSQVVYGPLHDLVGGAGPATWRSPAGRIDAAEALTRSAS